MKQMDPSKVDIRVRTAAIYLFAFGVPVVLILLGFLLGWWEALANAAG